MYLSTSEVQQGGLGVWDLFPGSVCEICDSFVYLWAGIS